MQHSKTFAKNAPTPEYISGSVVAAPTHFTPLRTPTRPHNPGLFIVSRTVHMPAPAQPQTRFDSTLIERLEADRIRRNASLWSRIGRASRRLVNTRSTVSPRGH